MKLKKFLLGGLIAIAGFASVFAIIQPNINGLTTTTSISTDYKLMVQSGTTQRAITAENFANSISGSFPLDEYYPLAGNSVSNPITGDLYMENSTGNYNLDIDNIPMNFGAIIDVLAPIITPTSYVPGMGAFKILITKGRNFFLGETGADTQMYMSNSDTTFLTRFSNRYDESKFSIDMLSGSVTNGVASFIFNGDGTLEAGTDISSLISDDKDFITKGYFDNNLDLSSYVTLGTYQVITGSKDFTGSLKILGPATTRLDWMGSVNTGWSTDENGIEYFGYNCSSFDPNSLMNKSCIEALVTGYSYIPYTSVDTGWNNTGSDTIIPSEKTVWGLVSGLTTNYIPYWSGDRFYNSNMLFYTNIHIGTYSVGDTAKLNIRNSSTTFSKGLNVTMLSGGNYVGVGLDIKASQPIKTETQDIGDPNNTINIYNKSADNAGYFMKNYVSSLGGFSSAISKGGNVFVASNASSTLSGGYYITSGSEATTTTDGSRRIVMSGANLSVQMYNGTTWVEKGVFTP